MLDKSNMRDRTHQSLKIEGFGGFAPRARPRAKATGGT